jgi:putative membrane protein
MLRVAPRPWTLSLVGAAVLAATVLSPAFASDESAQRRQQDVTFIDDTVSDQALEIALGSLALTHAQSDAVKGFGQRMVRDHGPANAQLLAIATAIGLQPPPTLLPEHQQELDYLSGLSGAAFDQAYMRWAVIDHTGDIPGAREEAINGRDLGLKQFANAMVPMLEEHLQMAHDVASSVGADVSISR